MQSAGPLVRHLAHAVQRALEARAVQVVRLQLAFGGVQRIDGQPDK